MGVRVSWLSYRNCPQPFDGRIEGVSLLRVSGVKIGTLCAPWPPLLLVLNTHTTVCYVFYTLTSRCPNASAALTCLHNISIQQEYRGTISSLYIVYMNWKSFQTTCSLLPLAVPPSMSHIETFLFTVLASQVYMKAVAQVFFFIENCFFDKTTNPYTAIQTREIYFDDEWCLFLCTIYQLGLSENSNVFLYEMTLVLHLNKLCQPSILFHEFRKIKKVSRYGSIRSLGRTNIRTDLTVPI